MKLHLSIAGGGVIVIAFVTLVPMSVTQLHNPPSTVHRWLPLLLHTYAVTR